MMLRRYHHAAALALVVLTSCGPELATINDANERAERAAQRAQAAELRAERSAELAAEAVQRTKPADYIKFSDGGMDVGEGSSEWWALKAENIAQSMCFVPAWPYGCSADHKSCWPSPEYLQYLKIQREACSGK